MIKLTRSRRRPFCPICGTRDCTCTPETPYEGKGEKAIVMPNEGTGQRRSRVFAPERIYEKTKHGRRLLYAKGSEIRPEDLGRLGFIKVEEPEVTPVDEGSKTAPKTRRPRLRKAAAPKPDAKPTPKPRGHRARKPKEES